MTFVRYVTQSADRWDLIAWRFYGSAYEYERIITANPTVAIGPTLPAGVELAIPVIPARTLALESLPPWKR